MYFVMIILWKPYHGVMNVHNHFLKLYYGTFVVFLVFCYMFSKVGSLSSSTYIIIMYLITSLICCVMVGGFVRVYLEYKFRKALDLDNTLLDEHSSKGIHK